MGLESLEITYSYHMYTKDREVRARVRYVIVIHVYGIGWRDRIPSEEYINTI